MGFFREHCGSCLTSTVGTERVKSGSVGGENQDLHVCAETL